ncbi:DNA damage-binding protein 2 isoform X1 [Huso huso]|uniref:DNA damage-binding protein 2 n=1 Tax=Huso huso TaxID=61971 RepID=A0ABR0YJF5_HUSHU
MAKKKMLLAVPEPECKKERTAPGRRKKEGQCPEEPSSKKLKVNKTTRTPGKAVTRSSYQTTPGCTESAQTAKQRSIIHYINMNARGQSIHSQLRQCLQQPFVRSLASYKLFRTASPFNRRVTSLEWHPTHPSTVAVGSKGGDLILWNYDVLNKTCFIQGKGAGDFIGGMKFSPTNPSQVYTASGDGTLSLQEFGGRTAQIISSTSDCWHDHHNVCLWYCSLDVSASRQVVVAGDNVGNTVLLSADGKEIWNLRLHKKKVTHVEFNPRCDWLLATASVDQTVKIWDMRHIKDKNSFLHELPHNKPINSAHFNPTDGSKLLTTDQYDEIRVYSSADWSKPQHTIRHPHRHFQHLTSIKATWHPLYDLIVAGRYPDLQHADELRTIDVFDANTGGLVCQLHNPNAPGIISLNKFNPMGDTLASGMGFNILIWSREEMVTSKQETLLKMMQEQGIGADTSRGQRGPQRRPRGEGSGNAELGKLKKKLASLESAGVSTKTKIKTKENTKPQKEKQKKKHLQD